MNQNVTTCNEQALRDFNIISRLKSGDQQFATKFFYGKNTNGCNISRFRSKLIGQIKHTYHYELSVEEFGNIVYTHLWDNGTWGVLDNYAGNSSLFCWLEKVSRHEVMRVLEEMNVINVNVERASGNTRLLGSSVSPDIWNLVITDLMPKGLQKDLLVASFVERKSERMMMKDFKLGAETLHTEIKKAETTLKDKLIHSGSYYEDLVLRDKSPRNIDMPEEYIKEFYKQNGIKEELSPLADILGVNLDKEDLNEKVVDFLYRFSANLPWTEEDKEIWRLRFIENTSPVEVAARCGKSRSWLDTRYSRLNKGFTTAIREWWRIHS